MKRLLLLLSVCCGCAASPLPFDDPDAAAPVEPVDLATPFADERDLSAPADVAVVADSADAFGTNDGRADDAGAPDAGECSSGTLSFDGPRTRKTVDVSGVSVAPYQLVTSWNESDWDGNNPLLLDIDALDINHDGHLDLVIADSNTYDGRFGGFGVAGATDLVLGHGDGTFEERRVTQDDRYAPWALAHVDVDADGFPDVVVSFSGVGFTPLAEGQRTDDRPAVFFGAAEAPGVRPTSLLFSLMSPISWTTAADLDRDGKEEIAAGTDTGLTEYSFSTGCLRSGSTLFLKDGANGKSAVADLDGDGYQDLAMPVGRGWDHSAAIEVFLGDQHGGFAKPFLLPVAGTPAGVLAVDLDADGRLDLLALTNDTGYSIGRLIAFQGTGHGQFGPFATTLIPAGIANFIAVVDPHGKQGVDFLVGTTDFEIWRATNTKDLQPILRLKLGDGGAFRAVLGDFNEDGLQDIAGINSTSVGLFTKTR